jgi:hypothetical protein
MIDFNHTPKPAQKGIPTQEQLDAAAQALSTPPRPYLGGSRLGEECARKLQYEFTATRPMRIGAKLHNIFAAGHASEEALAKLLKGIFDLRTEKANGFQFGFETAQGRIKGHIDGVICGGPDELGPYPYLWEAKAVGGKYYTALVKNGVRAERPVYAGQIATYQAYMELTENPALFSVTNRDTGEVHFERVPFDAKLAQECTDRGVQVLQAVDAGETLPRPYSSPDFYKCKFCDFAKECWRE